VQKIPGSSRQIRHFAPVSRIPAGTKITHYQYVPKTGTFGTFVAKTMGKAVKGERDER